MIRLISIIKKALQFLSISIRINKSVSTPARKRRFSKDASNWTAVVFMAVRLEKMMHFINLPASFNYEEHILNFPPEQYGFVDPRNEGFMCIRMFYILWQIGESASKHERAWKESGFIAISGITFQRRVQNYKQYLQYLIKTNVIESDNHYIPEVISFGYKFSERFSNEPLKRIALTQGTIGETFSEEVENFPYLTYWYKQNKLKIDSVTARKEAFNLYSSKKDNQEFWSRGKYGKLKPPLPQYYSAIQNISNRK